MSFTNRSAREYVVAVDLGGTNLACAIMDRGCNVVRRTIGPTRSDLGKEHVIDRIEEEIVRLSGQDPGRPAGIGIGAPGIVYSDKGIIYRAANLPDWQDVPLAQILYGRLSLPVFLRHDVDAAVLAEKYYGAGRGKDHVVCLTIGTGIGMGMILNGQLYCGAKAGAGNLGHMIMDRDVSPASDRDEGHLESLTAGPAIRTRAIEAIRQGHGSVLSDLCQGDLEKIDARMVFEAARTGDEVSLRIVHEMTRLLGIGIANIINLLNPEIVIVGGSIALAGEILFSSLVESVRAHVCSFLRADVQIVPAQLGDDAVLVGAAHTVWQSVAPEIPPGTLTKKH